MKCHGLNGNPLCDLKEWGYMYKNTHISTATHPILKPTSNRSPYTFTLVQKV